MSRSGIVPDVEKQSVPWQISDTTLAGIDAGGIVTPKCSVHGGDRSRPRHLSLDVAAPATLLIGVTTSPESIQNAGVRFPPPLVYLLGLVAALLINRAVRLPLAAPEPRWMFWLGILLMIAGALLSVWGISTFRRHGTAVIPFHPASTVVRSGPYAFTRNPMYVGMTTFFIGGGFLLDTWWAFVLLPVVVLIIDRQVIAREERYLASAFGAEYDAYRSTVRRWV